MERVAEAWSREMRRGYAKLAVLAIICKNPSCGYSIIKQFHERTMGSWRMTTGNIYPILRELEEKRCIEGTWESRGNRKRKIYDITTAGTHLLEAAVEKQQQIAETLERLIREYAREVLDAKLPTTVSSPIKALSHFKCLNDKPVEDQIKFLKHRRDRLETIIDLINERLAKLQDKKKVAVERVAWKQAQQFSK